MKFKILLLLLFIISLITPSYAQKLTISGFVKDKESLESLPSATIYVLDYNAGTTSNNYGFYSLTLPKNTYKIRFSFVGYEPKDFEVDLTTSNITFDVELEQRLKILKGVEISAERQIKNSNSNTISTINVPVTQIKTMPALLGEKDVFKSLQLLPGVKSGGEGSTGLFVRGGSSDQNLIILDDAPMYNTNHLFGFLSIFNGDAIKNINLTKGGFPARFGGRLSSVVEVTMKEGNKTKYSGEAGIGLLSSRLVLEGPLKKNVSSFLFSARRSYMDVIVRPFITDTEKPKFFFLDFNLKLNYDLGNKNKIYLSGYFGRDAFGYRQKEEKTITDFGLFWQNPTSTLRWNHIYNSKLFSNTSLIYSDYIFKIYSKFKSENNIYSLSYHSGIRDISLKHDFDYYISSNYSLKTGIQVINHVFTPSALVVKEDAHNLKKVKKYYSFENGLYVENHINVNNNLMSNIGFRLSHFVADKQHYFNPEPRVTVNYKLSDDFSAKIAYSAMNQYIHLLSNTGIGLPTDLWVPSTKNVKPQRSQQIALGFAKDVKDADISVSLEGYYKKSKNILGYLPNASFLLIDDIDSPNVTPISWEDNVTAGIGNSYGAELFVQKRSGTVSGWISYTLSWNKRLFEKINFGKEFWATQDRRHDLAIVLIYKITERSTLSATWVYGSSTPVTLPIGFFKAKKNNLIEVLNPNAQTNMNLEPNYTVYDYKEGINSIRLRDYHRLDISYQNHKKLTKYERTIEVGVYNVYNRKNPFFYMLSEEHNSSNKSKAVVKQFSLFPFIPSISYSIKF